MASTTPQPLFDRARAFMGANPWLPVFLIVYTGYFVLQNRFSAVPAYHDGRYWFEKAVEIAAHPWLPFVYTYDAGHPPLVPWLIALAWQFPGPRLELMHVVLWIFPAMFVTGVFEAGRRAFGWVAGLGAGMLAATHPTVVAQALQVNFDLPLAAFAWVAVAAAVAGSPWAMALALTGATMAKLNGMFVLGPFMVWAVFRLAWRGRLLQPREVFRAFWPLVLPLVVFGVYHAIKFRVTGHVFDTGEFESGKQTAMVNNMWDYGYRVFHNVMRMSNYNGLWYPFIIAVILAPLAILVSIWPGNRNAAAHWWLGISSTGNSGGFWTPLNRAELLCIAWLTVLVQVLLQALRLIVTLERYFIVCYPAVFLSLSALIVYLIRGKWQWIATAAIVLPMSFVYYLKWHPAYIAPFPKFVRDALTNLPDNLCHNHEHSLEFADMFVMLRHGMNYLDKESAAGEPRFIDIWWPFDLVATDPSQGITPTRHILGIHPGIGEHEYRFVFHHWACGKSPEQVAAEHPGFHLGRLEERGRLWLVVLRHDSLKPTP